MINQIIHGDCFEVLKTISDGSIDLILTDPPYGLSFMGKNWDHSVPGVQFWIEALRVAKPGAHLFAFGGTRTFHRLAVAIEDAGWEIRDTIMWVYGSGFPKSHDVSKAIDKAAGAEREVVGQRRQRTNNVSTSSAPMNASIGEVEFITAPATPEAKQWEGWGTALKPAWEPIIVARKPLTGTVAENVLQWGTGGINIDGCRVGTETWTRKGGDGSTPYGSETTWNTSKTPDIDRTATGRFPANLIHDGSEEVVGLFPETSPAKTGQRNPRGKHSTATYGNYAGIPGRVSGHNDAGGSAARFFYCAKASKSERGEGNIHPTVKPLALMKYLITLGLPPGGTVLDPFCGSGTTALACKELGRNYICIEKELEYYRIACNRLDQPIERE
jgi:site-specific DNA-methyltransferase (adenine-specific)